MTSPSADVLGYEKSIFDAGLHFARPAFTFQTSQWEPLAKETLSATSWGYIHGNCGSGSTYRNNLTAFSRWSIVPNRLVPSRRDEDGNEQFADTSTTVLGQKLPFPLAIAPIGVQKIFNPEGEAATARAAASLGVPYTLSTASSTSIEDVAAANGKDAPRWFQLYWPSREHDDITISMLNRAKASGYTALFVTLDTYVLGWRPSDLDNGYNPFIHPDHIGVEIGLTDPVFQKKFKEKHGYDITDAASGVYQAAQGGSAGASLGDAAREWAKIAIALGAKCVLVGRPYAYGLALGGEDGVRHVLRALCGDLTMNMHLAGLRDIGEVNRDILVKESDLV
ncbi:Aldolase-type TIM barrel [Fusarium oxysporum f. sp. vasinfectum]|nr:Aldolase-type TIM barrel [Fusarium oxysporum f. sp. vasinfectum]